MSKQIIHIDEEYRLITDDQAVMIERFVTIDPTKARNFNPEKHDPSIRQEWRNIGKYYSTIPKALTGLLEYKLRNGTAQTLQEVLDEINAFRGHIDGLMGTKETA